MTSRAYTKEETRAALLRHLHVLARYWGHQKCESETDRCEGMAFSILNIFDGTSATFPAIDLVMRPHPDDKQFHISEDENYHEDGTVLNDDCHLHDLFFTKTDPA